MRNGTSPPVHIQPAPLLPVPQHHLPHSRRGELSHAQARNKHHYEPNNGRQRERVHRQRGPGSIFVASSRVIPIIVRRHRYWCVRDALACLALVLTQDLRILAEHDIRAVVERVSVLAERHDLQSGRRPVAHRQVVRQLEPGHAQRAVACRVPEGLSQGVVEVGRVRTQTEVDENVGPGVVQVQLERAPVQGPRGNRLVREVGRDAGACIFFSSLLANPIRYKTSLAVSCQRQERQVEASELCHGWDLHG